MNIDRDVQRDAASAFGASSVTAGTLLPFEGRALLLAPDGPPRAAREAETDTWLPPGLHEDDSSPGAEDRVLAARLASLTTQQFKVLERVAQGRLNKQIADELGVQERTIKTHLSVIFEKLGVRNRTQAGVLLRSLELNDPARVAPPDNDAGRAPTGGTRA